MKKILISAIWILSVWTMAYIYDQIHNQQIRKNTCIESMRYDDEESMYVLNSYIKAKSYSDYMSMCTDYLDAITW